MGARKRDIAPDLWESGQLGRVSRDARLLFIGLIGHGDDEGRLRGDALYLKSRVFPYDADLKVSKVEEWLCALADERLICRYEVDGEHLLHLPTWHKWQSINRRYPSRIAACPRHADAVSTHLLSPELSCGLSEDAVSTHDALSEDSSLARRTDTDTVPVTGTVPGVEPETEDALPAPDGAAVAPSEGPHPVDLAPTKLKPVPKPTARVTTVDAAFEDALVARFSALMGSPEAVRDVIADAMSHHARDKRTDQQAYLRNWVRSEAEKAEARRGRSGPPRKGGSNGHTSQPGRMAAYAAAEEF